MPKHIKGVGGNQVWNGLSSQSLHQSRNAPPLNSRSDGGGWGETTMEGAEKNEVVVGEGSCGAQRGLSKKRRDSFPLWQVRVGWLHVSDMAGLCKGDEWWGGSRSDHGGMWWGGKGNTIARKPPPGASGYPSEAVYDPPPPLTHTHTHTHTHTRTNTSLGSIPIFPFSPATHFFQHFSTSDFVTHWQIIEVFLDLGFAAAGLHTLTHTKRKSHFCFCVQSQCLHTHAHTRVYSAAHTRLLRHREKGADEKPHRLSFVVLSFSTASTWWGAQIFNWLSQKWWQPQIPGWCVRI